MTAGQAQSQAALLIPLHRELVFSSDPQEEDDSGALLTKELKAIELQKQYESPTKQHIGSITLKPLAFPLAI